MNGDITGLTVFYDPGCGVCCRFRRWLESQALWLPVEFMGFREKEAEVLMPGLLDLGADRECIVLADDGHWWQGADAWLVCLWATREYRLWSSRLAAPVFRPVLLKVVDAVSSNRLKLSSLLGFSSDREVMAELEKHEVECEDDRCPWPEWPGGQVKGGAR